MQAAANGGNFVANFTAAVDVDTKEGSLGV